MHGRPSPRPEPAPPVPHPREDEVARLSDRYFLRTKETVAKFGDVDVTYAIFMRRPVIFCPRLVVDWLEAIAAARGTRFNIELKHAEGDWVGAGDALM